MSLHNIKIIGLTAILCCRLMQKPGNVTYLTQRLRFISQPNIYMHRKSSGQKQWFHCPELLPGSEIFHLLPWNFKC